MRVLHVRLADFSAFLRFAVIASAAKQSRFLTHVDCFVAMLLAMTLRISDLMIFWLWADPIALIGGNPDDALRPWHGNCVHRCLGNESTAIADISRAYLMVKNIFERALQVLPQRLRLFLIKHVIAGGKLCRVDILLANLSTNLIRLDLYGRNSFHGYDGVFGNEDNRAIIECAVWSACVAGQGVASLVGGVRRIALQLADSRWRDGIWQ